MTLTTWLQTAIRSVGRAIGKADQALPKRRKSEARLTLVGGGIGIVSGLLVGGSIGIATGGSGFGVAIWMICAVAGAVIGNRVGLEADRYAEVAASRLGNP